MRTTKVAVAKNVTTTFNGLNVLKISNVANFATTEYRYNHLKKFITSLTIVSFSSGLDSAIIKVIATKALLDIICLQSMIKCLFLFKNSKNKEAPILLQPFTKG